MEAGNTPVVTLRLTAEQLAAIRARLAAATPGPWEYSETDDGHEILMAEARDQTGVCQPQHRIDYDHGLWMEGDDGPEDLQAEEALANAIFIAAAPADIAALLRECEELTKELKGRAK